jgi:hypothetical protein
MSDLRASVWAPVVGLLAITLCVSEVSAHGPGSGARAGVSHSVSFGHGVTGFSRSGGGAFRSFSASHGNRTNFGSRSFSGNDIYYGIYGPYAYSVAPVPLTSIDTSAASSTHQLAQSQPGAVRQKVQVQASAKRAAEVCSNKASESAQWPIKRISEVVQPTDTQRPALDELKTAGFSGG